MPAPTYQEPHWYTQVMKTRCSKCHKVVFPDEETAQLRAKQISERTPMKAYKGRCGHWHMTRIRQH